MKNMHPSMVDRIKYLPQLNNFVSKVNETLSFDYPESFWDCKSVFEELIGSNFAVNLINYEMSRLVRDESYSLGDLSNSGFFIVNTDLFRLAIGTLEPFKTPTTGLLAGSALPNDTTGSKQVLHALTAHQMIGTYGDGEIDLEWYKQNNPHPIDVLDKNKTLTSHTLAKINSSRIGCFRAYEDVCQIIRPAKVCTVFFFTTKDFGSLRWEYDPDTLKPTKAIATNMNTSRLQWAADTLAELGCVDGTSALEHLYNHPDHFVRWSAVTNLIQLDYEKGTLLLEKSLHDAHPHIREAARASLEMLKDQMVK